MKTKNLIILCVILILDIILTLTLIKKPPISEQSVQFKAATIMSLSPYRFNPDLDIPQSNYPSYSLNDFVARGQEMMRQGEIQRADDIFKTALIFDPKNKAALKNAGEIAYMNSDFAGSCNYFTQFLAAFPDQIEGYTNLSIALLSLENLVQAEAIAKKGLQRFKEEQPAPFLLILASIKTKQGDENQANIYFNRAYMVFGTNITTFLNNSWSTPIKQLSAYRDIMLKLGIEIHDSPTK